MRERSAAVLHAKSRDSWTNPQYLFLYELFNVLYGPNSDFSWSLIDVLLCLSSHLFVQKPLGLSDLSLAVVTPKGQLREIGTRGPQETASRLIETGRSTHTTNMPATLIITHDTPCAQGTPLRKSDSLQHINSRYYTSRHERCANRKSSPDTVLRTRNRDGRILRSKYTLSENESDQINRSMKVFDLCSHSSHISQMPSDERLASFLLASSKMAADSNGCTQSLLKGLFRIRNA